MGKAYARMLQRQDPRQHTKIGNRIYSRNVTATAVRRKIFGCMQNRAVPTTKTAGIDASDAAPVPGCTPTNPHGQPAPLAAPSKLSCE